MNSAIISLFSMCSSFILEGRKMKWKHEIRQNQCVYVNSSAWYRLFRLVLSHILIFRLISLEAYPIRNKTDLCILGGYKARNQKKESLWNFMRYWKKYCELIKCDIDLKKKVTRLSRPEQLWENWTLLNVFSELD